MAAARPWLLEDDEEIARLLVEARSIAVVGMKASPFDDAYRVPAYLAAAGYRLRPVNPRLEGRTVLGERAVDSLADLDGPIDIVDLFRASDHVPAHAEEALLLSPRPLLFWMQLGVRNDRAARRLAAAGIQVVEDRCLMAEHRRLLGRRSGPGRSS